MERDVRTMLHKKQERINIKTGQPSISDMVESVPEFRYINGKLYYVVRYNNKLWYIESTNSIA